MTNNTSPRPHATVLQQLEAAYLEATIALAAFRKAKGERVQTTHPERDAREFAFESSYLALTTKIESLVAVVRESNLHLDQVKVGLRPNLDPLTTIDMRQLIELARSVRQSTQLCLTFDQIEAPSLAGDAQALSAEILDVERRFTVTRSIGFNDLERMPNAIPLTFAEAVEQANAWMSSTVTGNAEVIDFYRGERYEVTLAIPPRLPHSVEKARRRHEYADDMYGLLSLIYWYRNHQLESRVTTRVYPASAIERAYVEANTRKLCRCGSKIRLGQEWHHSDWEEHTGCCSQ